MCIVKKKSAYIFCNNNLYNHMRQRWDNNGPWVMVEKVKIQTPFWTCCDHKIITITCHGFTILLTINPKTRKKKFF